MSITSDDRLAVIEEILDATATEATDMYLLAEDIRTAINEPSETIDGLRRMVHLCTDGCYGHWTLPDGY